MNILRLIVEEKNKKVSPEFQKLQKKAACRDPGVGPAHLPKEEVKKRLTPMEYHVTQEKGTERPFSGKYIRLKEHGEYACIICGNHIFHSDTKYDSGSGWPSFNNVIAQGKVTVSRDSSHGVPRIEASCSQCGAHLGHVFDDGPLPSGLRYCVNSASLQFEKHSVV